MIMTHKRIVPLRLYSLISLKKGQMQVYARNYIEASKKLGVTPYEMRTYGVILKGKKGVGTSRGEC